MWADRKSDPDFDTYLKEIRAYNLLTAEEERALARVIQSDAWEAWDARDRMIRSNLRLVISVAKRYRNRGLALPDLVEEGNVGLVHAVEKFDPEMETRFSTYATWWIRQAIRRSILNTGKTVRIPSYMAEELNRWRAYARAFEQERGRGPTDEEMIAGMDPAPTRRRFLIRLFHGTSAGSDAVSLDTLFESVEALIDPRAQGPDLVDYAPMDRARVVELLGTLPDRDSQIVRMRFGLGEFDSTYTLRQIAKEMGLSRERVRQLEHQALGTLRRRLGVTADELARNVRSR